MILKALTFDTIVRRKKNIKKLIVKQLITIYFITKPLDIRLPKFRLPIPRFYMSNYLKKINYSRIFI